MNYKFKISFVLSGFGIFLAAIIFVFIPMHTKAADCPTLVAGDLFKVPDNSAVYLLNSDMQRLYFPHSSVYFTWYEDYSAVVEIPNTCVDNYPSPSAPPYGVNYRPGSKLIKVTISPSVYVVEPGNKKSKIGSEEVARALYGDDWASKVMDVADVFWPNYSTIGDELTSAIPHNGMLIKKSGSDNVYFIKNNVRYLVEGEPRNSVQTVSDLSFDYVADAYGSITKDSIYSDPTQISASTPVVGADDSQVIIDAKDEVVVEEDVVVRITSAGGQSIKPSIAWSGANYGIVWADDRGSAKTEIFFALLDEEGNKVVEDVQITNTPTLVSTNPEIVWNDNGFGIVYNEYSEDVDADGTVNFVRINNQGARLGSVVELSDTVDRPNPSIAWNGSGYGVVWRTPSNTSAKTYFSFLDSEGSIVTNQKRVITAESSDQTEIIWDGDKFAIVYRKAKEILGYGDTPTHQVGTYLHRVDKNADSTRSELFITKEEAIAFIWDGSNYVTVEDSNTLSSFMANANLSVTNAKISDESLSDPDIIFGSDRYGVVAQRDGLVRFIEVNKNGTIQQIDMQINDVINTASSTPRIGWSGSKYGIVWSDTKDANSGAEIYFKSQDSL